MITVRTELEVGHRVLVEPAGKRLNPDRCAAGLEPARVSAEGPGVVEKLHLQALCAYVHFDDGAREWIECERLTLLGGP